jgi:hypothetical protein
MTYAAYGGALLFLCGVISARWALELNYGQGRQLVYFVSGLLLGPLRPLIHLPLVRQPKKVGA